MIILIQNQKRDTVVTLNGSISINSNTLNFNYDVYHDDTLLGSYAEKEKAYWIFEYLANLPDAAVHKLQDRKKLVGIAPSSVEFIQMPE